MTRTTRLIAALLVTSWTSLALAHHSFAMFDARKSASQKGVIKEVQWTNPHVWVHLTVQEGGKEVVTALDKSAPRLKRVTEKKKGGLKPSWNAVRGSWLSKNRPQPPRMAVFSSICQTMPARGASWLNLLFIAPEPGKPVSPGNNSPGGACG